MKNFFKIFFYIFFLLQRSEWESLFSYSFRLIFQMPKIETCLLFRTSTCHRLTQMKQCILTTNFSDSLQFQRLIFRTKIVTSGGRQDAATFDFSLAWPWAWLDVSDGLDRFRSTTLALTNQQLGMQCYAFWFCYASSSLFRSLCLVDFPSPTNLLFCFRASRHLSSLECPVDSF